MLKGHSNSDYSVPMKLGLSIPANSPKQEDPDVRLMSAIIFVCMNKDSLFDSFKEVRCQ